MEGQREGWRCGWGPGKSQEDATDRSDRASVGLVGPAIKCGMHATNQRGHGKANTTPPQHHDTRRLLCFRLSASDVQQTAPAAASTLLSVLPSPACSSAATALTATPQHRTPGGTIASNCENVNPAWPRHCTWYLVLFWCCWHDRHLETLKAARLLPRLPFTMQTRRWLLLGLSFSRSVDSRLSCL
jgi:hypothetical protein